MCRIVVTGVLCGMSRACPWKGMISGSIPGRKHDLGVSSRDGVELHLGRSPHVGSSRGFLCLLMAGVMSALVP
jgi:hypothetical protein